MGIAIAIAPPLAVSRGFAMRRSSCGRSRTARPRSSTASSATTRTRWLLAVFAGLLAGSLRSATTTTKTTTIAEALVLRDPIGVGPSRRPGSALGRLPTTTTALGAGGGGKKPKKAQGVYVRPSGAIEKGSGFFVPGLEGPKVRLVIGVVLLAATAVNHLVYGADLGSFGRTGLNGAEPQEFLSFSEGTAVAYSVLILFQSAIEYAKEALPEPGAISGSEARSKASAARSQAGGEATEVLDQKWSSSAGDDDDDADDDAGYREKVQWAAASYVSMTPTTQILLLGRRSEDDGDPGSVRYRLGTETGPDGGEGTGVSAALEELSRSKGGRIALPPTHPAVEALLPSSGESRPRTVILQRITDESCWMVASDQLLAGYTKGDLRWLGKLAGYVAAAAAAE